MKIRMNDDVHVLVNRRADHASDCLPIVGREIAAASSEADTKRSANNNHSARPFVLQIRLKRGEPGGCAHVVKRPFCTPGAQLASFNQLRENLFLQRTFPTW